MAPGDVAVRGQVLDRAVEVAALLQPVDQPLVHRQHRVLLRAGVAQQDVLLVVVTQHQSRDVVGHLDQQLVALLGGQVAVGDDLAEQDLDVDLVVGAVDAGRVVDGVGVDPDAVQRGLDPAELGQAEVAALADDPAAQRRRR